MNEQEWLKSTNPAAMLRFLSGTATNRKLACFACTCCRRIWPLLIDDRSRTSVEVVEQFIDNRTNSDQLIQAIDAHEKSENSYDAKLAWWAVFRLPMCVLVNWRGDEIDRAIIVANGAAEAAGDRNVRNYDDDEAAEVDFRLGSMAERKVQCDFVRDIFGNPFRPVEVDAAWLTFRAEIIPRIAQRIYNERSFADLPILADALEDAGCTNADILAHCRQSEEHVRGCWVIDLLLGNQ